MANYLDANPDEAARVKSARENGFVPIVSDGFITLLAGHRQAGGVPVPDDITAEDYAVGLEVLGYRHDAIRQRDGSLMLCLTLPLQPGPPEWGERARALFGAFNVQDRRHELARFIVDRDGEVS